MIPIRLFAPTDATSLSGKTYRGNFYKCAELSGKPHFVTWNPIRLEEPDFHRPDFFGEIEFE